MMLTKTSSRVRHLLSIDSLSIRPYRHIPVGENQCRSLSGQSTIVYYFTIRLASCCAHFGSSSSTRKGAKKRAISRSMSHKSCKTEIFARQQSAVSINIQPKVRTIHLLECTKSPQHSIMQYTLIINHNLLSFT